jgi:dCMP deaminase
MKPKHLAIRIEQCLALAKASNCPRRKFGALLIDPKRNVILMDGYNGGPRGADGDLCAGHFCERDGLPLSDLTVTRQWGGEFAVGVKREGDEFPVLLTAGFAGHAEAQAKAEALAEEYPPIESGTRMERGCHHAEMNVVCNAAAGGVATAGAWLICTGEPCMMCSKLIHHAGIVKVIVVDGGYIGHNGVGYLEQHGVEVERTAGPQDPRAQNA